jgi:hypothetical protein
MKIINRKMESTETKTAMDSAGRSQASFNSNGCLVLRNYNEYGKDNDEIILLSETETNAIIRLFQKLKSYDILPF